MVIVNTVVVVRGVLGRTDSDVAIALACFGGGSMAAALLLPLLLDRFKDRSVMLRAALLLGLTLLGFAGLMSLFPANIWPALLLAWIILGVGYSVMTPSGRLLRRSAHAADRPAVFAAQSALSHACWLLTYPLAGWLGSCVGMVTVLLVLTVLTFAGALAAQRFCGQQPIPMLSRTSIRSFRQITPIYVDNYPDTCMPM